MFYYKWKKNCSCLDQKIWINILKYNFFYTTVPWQCTFSFSRSTFSFLWVTPRHRRFECNFFSNFFCINCIFKASPSCLVTFRWKWYCKGCSVQTKLLMKVQYMLVPLFNCPSEVTMLKRYSISERDIINVRYT